MKNLFFEGDLLTSRQNGRVKEFDALRDKKYRDARRLFRLDGRKLYLEALLCGVEIVETFVRDSSAEEIGDWIAARLPQDGTITRAPGVVHRVSDEVFEKLSEEKSPEGILCAAKYIDKFHKIITIDNISANAPAAAPLLSESSSGGSTSAWDEAWAAGTAGSCLLLETIQDPGNLGTILRSAAAFGASALILSGDCADIYHPRTLRGAMGAVFRLPIFRVEGRSLEAAVRRLRSEGHRVFAAALDREAAALGRLPLRAGDCVAIGNEGHGLAAETIFACDRSLFIPMTEGSESLNAAIAASVFLWELAKADGSCD